MPEPHSLEGDPGEKAISREEESLLWRTLGALPENYREPLILFYREQQSIAQVAAQLDLSEDTVKQRLSRGRAMLREELATEVESTLTRSRPGAAFTTGVLAALPLTAISVASATAAGAAAGKGLTTAKASSGLGLGALLGPLLGVAIVSLDASSQGLRTARGWIAMGDVAISPLFGFGGIAVAPVAVGGLTVGLLSLSLWGAAVGVVRLRHCLGGMAGRLRGRCRTSPGLRRWRLGTSCRSQYCRSQTMVR